MRVCVCVCVCVCVRVRTAIAIACSFVIVGPNVNIPQFMAQSITSPLPLTDPQINVEHSKPTTWIKFLPKQITIAQLKMHNLSAQNKQMY